MSFKNEGSITQLNARKVVNYNYGGDLDFTCVLSLLQNRLKWRVRNEATLLERKGGATTTRHFNDEESNAVIRKVRRGVFVEE